jgi:hypothetical protein
VAGRKAWASISGNTKEPELLGEFGMEDAPGATGLRWMLAKPPAWQNQEEDVGEQEQEENPHSYNRQLSSMPDSGKRQRAMSSSKKMPITDFLRSIPTFQSVDETDIHKLESSSSLQIFGNGSSILAHDQKSDFIYVIREGNVKVMKKKDKVMNLTQGDYFGEGSFTNRTSGSQQS